MFFLFLLLNILLMGCAQPGMIDPLFVYISFILKNTSYKLKSNICVTHLGKTGGQKRQLWLQKQRRD